MDTTALEFRTRTPPSGIRGNVATGHLTVEQTERYLFEGLWHSEGGSLYVCAGQALVCISVHSAAFRGWIGKVAVRDIHRAAGAWRGWQAFRNKQSGVLADWQPVTLSISGDRMTKYFPGSLSARILVYGHVEHYYRVYHRQER